MSGKNDQYLGHHPTPTLQDALRTTPDASQDPGHAPHGSHGIGHRLMMLICCIPMLVVVAVLVATGAAGSGAILFALLCAAMMAAMMFAMPGGGHRH